MNSMRIPDLIATTLLATTLIFAATACVDGSPDLPAGEHDGTWTIGEGAEEAMELVELCSPRAISYVTSPIPSLPQEVFDDACPLVSVEEWYGQEETRVGTISYVRDGDEVQRIRTDPRHGEVQWTTYAMREGRPGTIEDHFRYAGAQDSYRKRSWAYDEEGRLLSFAERSVFRGVQSQDTEVSQVWSAGRLVEARETRSEQGQVEDLSFHWEYDDVGRLESARVTTSKRPEAITVQWSYSPDGLPESVVRRVGEVQFSSQRWQWEGEGRLKARSVSVDRLAIGEGVEAHDWAILMGRVDDFYPGNDLILSGLSPDSYMENHWPDALFRTRGDCVMPPTSLGHGYPDGEAEYHLGWARGDRPHGIGFAYGYGGYGWNYGDDAWFGHEGVASYYWPGAVVHHRRALWVEMEYDPQGRMVREEIQGLVAEIGTHIERIRTFEDSGLREDLATARLDAAAPVTRTLTFSRDARGALRERGLFHEEVELARHEWTRTEGGQVLEHRIYTRDMDHGFGLFPEPVMTGELSLSTSYTIEYDDEGNPIEDFAQTHPTNRGEHLRYACD